MWTLYTHFLFDAHCIKWMWFDGNISFLISFHTNNEDRYTTINKTKTKREKHMKEFPFQMIFGDDFCLVYCKLIWRLLFSCVFVFVFVLVATFLCRWPVDERSATHVSIQSSGFYSQKIRWRYVFRIHFKWVFLCESTATTNNNNSNQKWETRKIEREKKNLIEVNDKWINTTALQKTWCRRRHVTAFYRNEKPNRKKIYVSFCNDASFK